MLICSQTFTFSCLTETKQSDWWGTLSASKSRSVQRSVTSSVFTSSWPAFIAQVSGEERPTNRAEGFVFPGAFGAGRDFSTCSTLITNRGHDNGLRGFLLSLEGYQSKSSTKLCYPFSQKSTLWASFHHWPVVLGISSSEAAHWLLSSRSPLLCLLTTCSPSLFWWVWCIGIEDKGQAPRGSEPHPSTSLPFPSPWFLVLGLSSTAIPVRRIDNAG